MSDEGQQIEDAYDEDDNLNDEISFNLKTLVKHGFCGIPRRKRQRIARR